MMTKLNDKMLKLYVTAKCLMIRDEGQDLIEYALLVALVAFAATVGMTSLATGINAAFTAIGTKLTTYTA